jgi:hypothetical protein
MVISKPFVSEMQKERSPLQNWKRYASNLALIHLVTKGPCFGIYEWFQMFGDREAFLCQGGRQSPC